MGKLLVLITGNVDSRDWLAIEHSNSGKKVSIRFDSILATESIFSIRFGNLINLPLVH